MNKLVTGSHGRAVHKVDCMACELIQCSCNNVNHMASLFPAWSHIWMYSFILAWRYLVYLLTSNCMHYIVKRWRVRLNVFALLQLIVFHSVCIRYGMTKYLLQCNYLILSAMQWDCNEYEIFLLTLAWWKHLLLWCCNVNCLKYVLIWVAKVPVLCI